MYFLARFFFSVFLLFFVCGSSAGADSIDAIFRDRAAKEKEIEQSSESFGSSGRVVIIDIADDSSKDDSDDDSLFARFAGLFKSKKDHNPQKHVAVSDDKRKEDEPSIVVPSSESASVDAEGEEINIDISEFFKDDEKSDSVKSSVDTTVSVDNKENSDLFADISKSQENQEEQVNPELPNLKESQMIQNAPVIERSEINPDSQAIPIQEERDASQEEKQASQSTKEVLNEQKNDSVIKAPDIIEESQQSNTVVLLSNQEAKSATSTILDNVRDKIKEKSQQIYTKFTGEKTKDESFDKESIDINAMNSYKEKDIDELKKNNEESQDNNSGDMSQWTDIFPAQVSTDAREIKVTERSQFRYNGETGVGNSHLAKTERYGNFRKYLIIAIDSNITTNLIAVLDSATHFGFDEKSLLFSTVDEYGHTVLNRALFNKGYSLIHFLLSKGFGIDSFGTNGITAGEVAYAMRDETALDILRKDKVDKIRSKFYRNSNKRGRA